MFTTPCISCFHVHSHVRSRTNFRTTRTLAPARACARTYDLHTGTDSSKHPHARAHAQASASVNSGEQHAENSMGGHVGCRLAETEGCSAQAAGISAVTGRATGRACAATHGMPAGHKPAPLALWHVRGCAGGDGRGCPGWSGACGGLGCPAGQRSCLHAHGARARAHTHTQARGHGRAQPQAGRRKKRVRVVLRLGQAAPERRKAATAPRHWNGCTKPALAPPARPPARLPLCPFSASAAGLTCSAIRAAVEPSRRFPFRIFSFPASPRNGNTSLSLSLFLSLSFSLSLSRESAEMPMRNRVGIPIRGRDYHCQQCQAAERGT